MIGNVFLSCSGDTKHNKKNRTGWKNMFISFSAAKVIRSKRRNKIKKSGNDRYQIMWSELWHQTMMQVSNRQRIEGLMFSKILEFPSSLQDACKKILWSVQLYPSVFPTMYCYVIPIVLVYSISPETFSLDYWNSRCVLIALISFYFTYI